jgi:RNA polymerase primary sigma factor
MAVSGHKCQALKQLTDQQVRFAPPAKRREQAEAARKLLAEIDPARRYPYQFVCFRVTGFRPDSHPDLLIDGADLADDLRETIRLLDDPILTLEEVSRRLNVSTKTIRRWRDFGLAPRKIVTEGRSRLGFPLSAVDDFVASQTDRVERGGRFSQLSDNERSEILCSAKRLAAAGGSLTDVSRSIARDLGRSAEAVRYTIKNYDREHPDRALFPRLTGPLDQEAKEVIFTSYRRGIAVEMLAKRYQRTRTSVYRVINEVRAQRLLDQPLDYIPHPSFADAGSAAVILGPMPDADTYETRRLAMRVPKDVPPELAPLYEVPLLSKEQEQHLFRQFNYLKYRAAALRDQLRKDDAPEDVDPAQVRVQLLDEIEELLEQAQEVKDRLINANMRLVVNIAKRHAAQTDNFFELLSDGNMSLIRAVEKFDFGRGFKFSTYASWAIMKNFARTIPDEKHRRERFVTGHDEVFEVAPDTRGDEHEALASQERATANINKLLEHLEPREREIIRLRAGLDDAKGMTLEEIGQQFGITKERVRQLNARAMKKLRTIAEEQHLDF